MKNEIKMVIVIRKDLNMRKGKIGSQVGHAAMGFLLDNNDSTKTNQIQVSLTEEEITWFETGHAKIVVGCDTQEELETLMLKAQMKEIQFHKIIDEGRTEFNRVPTLTCCAFGPDDSEKLDSLTGHLKLL